MRLSYRKNQGQRTMIHKSLEKTVDCFQKEVYDNFMDQCSKHEGIGEWV